MKVFIANGAPRTTGHTHDVLAQFVQGVTRAGGDADVAALGRMDVRPCRGCYSCWNSKTGSVCAIRDDVPSLIDRYMAADIAVFATPLYFYSFSSIAKAFIERMLSTLSPYLERGESGEMVHHEMRFPGRGPRKCALIVVAGHRDAQVLSGILPTFDLMRRALHLEWIGTILRPEAFFLDYAIGKEKTIRMVQNATIKAGEELVTRGRIEPETAATAALPIARNLDAFIDQSRRYWEVVLSGDHFITDRDVIKKEVLCDMRIVMPVMANSFDPTVAGDLEAIVNFRVGDGDIGHWHFTIARGRCDARQGLHPRPTISIETDTDTWMAILRSKLDPRLAITQQRLAVTGDMRLFSRFSRLFPSNAT